MNRDSTQEASSEDSAVREDRSQLLDRLARAASALSDEVTLAEVVAIVVGEAVLDRAAEAGAIVLPNRHHLEVSACVGFASEAVTLGAPIPSHPPSPVTEAAAGREFWFGSRQEAVDEFPVLEQDETAFAASVTLPVRLNGRPAGALRLAWRHPHVFARDERTFLRGLADLVGFVAQRRQDRAAVQRLHTLEESHIGLAAGKGDRILEANDALLAMLGQPRERLEEGIEWRSITQDEELPPPHTLGKEIQGGWHRTIRKRFVRPDGTPVPVQLVGVDATGDDWFVAVSDMTEWERLQQIADTEAAITSTLLQSAPVGFALFDRDLRFTRINSRLAEINGLSVEEHLGRFAFDAVPELRESAEPILRHVLETGDPVEDVQISGETPAQPGIIRDWTESFFPIRHADGTTVGIAAVATETTERKRLEAALAKTAGVIEAVIMTAPVGLGILDQEGRFVRVNETLATINGIPAEAHLGRSVEELLPADLADGWAEIITTALKDGQAATDLEFQGRNARGEHHEVLAHYYPIRDSSGATAGVGIVLVDVTDRNRLDQAARQGLTSQLVEQSTALHELQSMLLPELPDVGGLEIQARYRAAETIARVGGDWYDAFETESGVVVAVGDASGHGLSGVTTMDMARNAICSFLLNGASLAEALTGASRALSARGADYATSIVARIDTSTGAIEYINAGHPPPLIRGNDNRCRLLETAHGTPLGAYPNATYAFATDRLEPGETLVLYTDGLIERREGPGIDQCISRLCQILGTTRDIDTITREALDGSSQEDDVCIVLATRTP